MLETINTTVFNRQHRIVCSTDYSRRMDGIGDRVKREREAKVRPDGKVWSQTYLAKMVTQVGYPIKQSGIGNIEAGITKNPSCIAGLAEVLGVTVPYLRTGRGPKTNSASQSAVQIFNMGAIQHSHSGGGSNTTAILWRSSMGDGSAPGVFMLNEQKGRPIERPASLSGEDKAFAFRVVGKENEPVYRVKDVLWVNPEEVIEAGEDCLFVRDPNNLEGSPSIVARLVRITDRSWIVKQHAIEGEQTLSRKEWANAWIIVGRERRR